ncbi:MAG: 16S rRNA (adenine(1518)-N(6)/adenine(1519)-N(6))-dimethyltransferase RsmA [candidate division Zixibacteria bacterium]|nr:16S rRNA (adenine(1518)-N(6)/adenine(1519)-N(6))-dimethyltransferase RsmA [candidate division Zixibacteria bacterium]
MIRAKKSLGQHFLSDPIVASQIIEALTLRSGETVLEIGPGHGALTHPLVNTGANVVAVELDRVLAPELARTFEKQKNFRVVEADILTIDPAALGLDRFVLLGNLPYNITTPVIDWMLKYHPVIDRAVLMMQKEVAERIASPPGRRARSTISVITSLYYDCRTACDVPPRSFTPPPKVDSAVVLFTRHDRTYAIDNLPRFEKMVRLCFAGKRKSLLNNLNSAYPIQREELVEVVTRLFGSSTIRAEQMTLDDFIRLAGEIFSRV